MEGTYYNGRDSGFNHPGISERALRTRPDQYWQGGADEGFIMESNMVGGKRGPMVKSVCSACDSG